jgi:hypothetical protein
MYHKKSFRLSSLLIFVTFVICLNFPLFASVKPSLGNPDYTYYGVVPARICLYVLNDWNASFPDRWGNLSSGWTIATYRTNYAGGSLCLNGSTDPNAPLIATKSLLAVVAAKDGTDFKVYNLTLSNWLPMYEGHLDSMGKYLMLLANGTIFKVVSNKQVSVLLLNYQQIPPAKTIMGPGPTGFYTSTDGLYVGKEFILMTSGQVLPTSVYILALEKSTVTITDEDGTQITQFTLDANSYKPSSGNPNGLALGYPFKVYKIESTGNIMVQSGSPPVETGRSVSCFPVPAAKGGFVGTYFLTDSIAPGGWVWDPGEDYGYRISALEDTHVNIYDLQTQKVIDSFSVARGTGVAKQPVGYAIAVQSDNPVTLSLIHNGSLEQSLEQASGGKYQGYANGVMFIDIRPNQETMIHLPTEAHDEAYFFANNETQLTIDGTAHTIPAGSSYFYNQPGTHTVESSNNVVVQVNFWPLTPDYQGLWYGGAIIPCIETVNDIPNVTLTPIGGGFPMMYVIAGAGAGAVVVVVVVSLLMMRRRKPS